MSLPADGTLADDSPGALAAIRTYAELHQALRKRADELRVTRLSMDEVGGMPPGYFAKVLAPEQIRLVGRHSMGALLGVLGLKLLVVEDRDALARYSARAQKRKIELHANGRLLTKRRPGFARLSGNSEWGKSMRQLGILKTGARRRKRIAQTAARARWARHRARQMAEA